MKRFPITDQPAIAGLTGIFVVLLILTTLNFAVDDIHEGSIMLVLELVGPLCLIGILGYVNYLVIIDSFEDQQYMTIFGWTALTTVTAVAFVLIYFVHLSVDGHTLPPSEMIDAVVFGATAGAAGGGLASFSKARATYYNEKIRSQRDVFRLLNTSLRHNVLNGINIINGCAQQIRERTNGENRHNVDIIAEQSEVMEELVENTKTISRFFSNEDERKRINISKILAEEVKTAKVSHPEVMFSTNIEAPVHLEGTPLLRSVFSNLLNNAIEHNDVETPQVDVTLNHCGDEIEVCVADNGPGIPDANKQSVFQKQTYSEEIGLYVVKSIIDELGGDIAVEDNDPRGTIFRVAIPIGSNQDNPAPNSRLQIEQ